MSHCIVMLDLCESWPGLSLGTAKSTTVRRPLAGTRSRAPTKQVALHPLGSYVGRLSGPFKTRHGMSLRAAPWTAVAAATAFLVLVLPPFPRESQAEGGSCCYRSPRRPSPAVNGTYFEIQLQTMCWVASPPHCVTCYLNRCVSFVSGAGVNCHFLSEGFEGLERHCSAGLGLKPNRGGSGHGFDHSKPNFILGHVLTISPFGDYIR